MTVKTILGCMLAIGLCGCVQQASQPVLQGDYLGQTQPGKAPELFAPGIVSTKCDELNSLFSPNGNEFIFSIKMPAQREHTLVHMLRQGDRWTEPKVLQFSGHYDDADPAFSPDGQQLFFTSRRPLSGSSERRSDWDLWVVERSGTGWSEPKHLEDRINTDRLEVYPSLTASGTLYFSSGREGGMGRNDIYRSSKVDGQYTEPENLGEAINSKYSEGDIFIAPDESYIIFVGSGRPDSHGSGDLYISFQGEDSAWTTARNMGTEVNSSMLEYCPTVTPDGKYLFFTSHRAINEVPMQRPLTYRAIADAYDSPHYSLGDIYWMDAGVIEEMRAEVMTAKVK